MPAPHTVSVGCQPGSWNMFLSPSKHGCAWHSWVQHLSTSDQNGDCVCQTRGRSPVRLAFLRWAFLTRHILLQSRYFTHHVRKHSEAVRLLRRIPLPDPVIESGTVTTQKDREPPWALHLTLLTALLANVPTGLRGSQNSISPCCGTMLAKNRDKIWQDYEVKENYNRYRPGIVTNWKTQTITWPEMNSSALHPVSLKTKSSHVSRSKTLRTGRPGQ